MKITCPECGFSGNVKDELIPENGRNIGCPKCKKNFFVEKEAGFTLGDESDVPPNDHTPKPKKSSKPVVKTPLLKEKNKSYLIPFIIVCVIITIPLYVVGSCVNSCSPDTKPNVVKKEKPKPSKPKVTKPKEIPKKYIIVLKDDSKIECVSYREEEGKFYYDNGAGIEGFVNVDFVLKILEGDEVVYRKKTKEELRNEQIEKRKNQIERNFSAWDGSHRGLTKLIKKAMNDPSSYKHVEIVYWDMGDHLIVKTTFRGKNAFGAVIKNWVKAKVDLDGNVIEIISQGS